MTEPGVSPVTDALAVLEERARALARPPLAPEAGDTLGLMTFALADNVYAVESRFVREVARLTHLAALPGAEPQIAGLTLWRGELLPVIDVAPLFGDVDASRPVRRTILVLDGNAAAEGYEIAGLAADTPGELRTLSASLLRSPPDSLSASAKAYVRGMLPDGVLVLDVARVWELIGPEFS